MSISQTESNFSVSDFSPSDGPHPKPQIITVISAAMQIRFIRFSFGHKQSWLHP
jgi:hypothetical protein